MRKGGCRSRVGQVVGRNVNGLEAGDGAFGGRGDALLQIAHLRGERGLVTHGAGRAAQQCGDFRAGLRKAKDVVDEQQHILVVLVTKILGHGERRERDAETGPGRLVHLAIDQTDPGAGLQNGKAVGASFQVSVLVLLAFNDIGLCHFVVKVVALARALTDAGKHGDAPVQFGNVVDQLRISSWSTTVLPTPAPPNAPTLPPLRNGQMRSITLMPVTSTCGEVDWSTSGGALR